MVYNVYKQSIQQYLTNEDRVGDYLGYRQDDDMIRVNLILVDRDYASLFRRKILCELWDGLLQTDEERSMTAQRTNVTHWMNCEQCIILNVIDIL